MGKCFTLNLLCASREALRWMAFAWTGMKRALDYEELMLAFLECVIVCTYLVHTYKLTFASCFHKQITSRIMTLRIRNLNEVNHPCHE